MYCKKMSHDSLSTHFDLETHILKETENKRGTEHRGENRKRRRMCAAALDVIFSILRIRHK